MSSPPASPPPAFSSLRDRFEQISSSSSPKPMLTPRVMVPASTDHQHKRMRIVSTPDDLLRPQFADVSSSLPLANTARPLLRNSPSSPDLNASFEASAPAPIRANSPATLSAIMRKPPPPPPPTRKPSAAEPQRTQLHVPCSSVSELQKIPPPIPNRTQRALLTPPRSPSIGLALPQSPVAPPLPSRTSRDSTTSAMNFAQKHDGRSISAETFDSDDTPSSSSSKSWSHGGSFSRTSSESDPPDSSSAGIPPLLPPRPQPSPLLPPRPRPSSPSEDMPPPLPIRRTPATSNEALPPPLPVRRTISLKTSDESIASSPPTPQAALPKSKIMPTIRVAPSTSSLPPPTRTIALGDKLPPRKRSSGTDDSESDDDNSIGGHKKLLDDLPDSSRANRRPPYLRRYQPAISVPAHFGLIATAGNHICVATHHHLKIYDLAKNDSTPVFTLDLKDLHQRGGKEPKVTAMEFKSVSSSNLDEGRYLWCGTKDGQLWELDLWVGDIISMKSQGHVAPVTHILRGSDNMITIDESGKVFIFFIDAEDGIIRLTGSPPRSVRVVEKQNFAKLFGRGTLWTSNGHGGSTSSSNTVGHHIYGGSVNGSGPGLGAGPIVRIYDVESPNFAVKTLVVGDALGAITSGTILPSRPDWVYLGHEGGYVTVWHQAQLSASPTSLSSFTTSSRSSSPSTPTSYLSSSSTITTPTHSMIAGGGGPICLMTIKISTSDILSLEGVGSRLWAGTRAGLISAYNVETRPWTVTNVWRAHGELPITKLAVDPYSIAKLGRLCVVSVGRDEQVRLWDGLLGSDWIESELLKREASFSAFRDITVLICTWNIDAVKPETLNTSAGDENSKFLTSCLKSVDKPPDIIVFGFQEVINLEDHKLTAKTVLLSKTKRKAEGTLPDKVSRHYRLWYNTLVYAIRQAMPSDCQYTLTQTENLVGLFTCIFVRNTEQRKLKDAAITTVKRGMGGRFGNKGAIVARFTIDDSSLCFINCHLAAGQNHKRARNRDLAAILEEKSVFPDSFESSEPTLAYVGGGDGSMILDHEICFLNGDLNYRIDQRREVVMASIRAGELDYLLSHDQLLKEIKTNGGFRLRAFTEAPITFAPTYKYDRNSNEYDTSEKRRVPAWCDRILYRCRDSTRVKSLHYQRYEVDVSDHRPVTAAFRVTLKSVNTSEREITKTLVENEWRDRQRQLLIEATTFYQGQSIL